jgi:hypothetical protein
MNKIPVLTEDQEMPSQSFHLQVKQNALFRLLDLLISTAILLSTYSPKTSTPQSTDMPAPGQHAEPGLSCRLDLPAGQLNLLSSWHCNT